MATTTTTTRSKRRKVAAILLVGLGVTSLGVASASHLTVKTTDDLVASGVATSASGYFGNATATVSPTYVSGEQLRADDLAVNGTLLMNSANVKLSETTAKDEDAVELTVFFYKSADPEKPGTPATLVAKGSSPHTTGKALKDGLTVSLTDPQGGAIKQTPVYNRIAVIVEKTPTE